MATDIDTSAKVKAAKAELNRGECLKAFDIARSALNENPGDVPLAHMAVLALARSGATAQATKLFMDSGLNEIENVEILGLKARLAKDIALAATDPREAPETRQAIDAYRRGYELTQEYYPAINVAFLQLLAGDMSAWTDWATKALEATGDEQSYYADATRAEALLLLRRLDEASIALQRAADRDDASIGDRSSTWKQLNRVCKELDLDAAALAPIKPPPVAHFCGHIIAAPGLKGRFPAEQEADVQRKLAEFFENNPCSRVFGSLAAGADILAAEAALATGADLIAVLPFNADEFIRISVDVAGADWRRRYDACIEAATDVMFVTPDDYLEDNALFGYASQFALGLARQHAEWLQTDALQIAVSDGEDGPNPEAGTGHDIVVARDAGFIQSTIAVQSNREPVMPPTAKADENGGNALQRNPRAIIFGDLKGFSRLTDAKMPQFVSEILGAMASAVEAFDARIEFRNTWGDGIYLVLKNPASAAACGFALQDAVRQALKSSTALPPTLGLRLGMHFGPVFEMNDPVLGRKNFFGSHVSHAARTEPNTPEGEIYVTAQTAAALALDSHDTYRCDYVGRIPLAKNYGEYPMYHLRRVDR